MFNILKKGDINGCRSFETKQEMDEFFLTHDKKDYLILGDTKSIRLNEREKAIHDFNDHMIELSNNIQDVNLENDLDMKIENGEAIRIHSSINYDFYVLYFGIFVRKHKVTGKVRTVKYFWVPEAKNFYININNKRKLAAKIVYETFCEKVPAGYKIGFKDNNRANLDIDNLYIFESVKV